MHINVHKHIYTYALKKTGLYNMINICMTNLFSIL